MDRFDVALVKWYESIPILRSLRYWVFIVEQHVPEDLEWDGLDPECWHVLASAATGDWIGTARMSPDGRIGRMAVLREWRGRGVGSAMLSRLVEVAREKGYPSVFLHAQTHAIEFYARHGFVIEGDEFAEAGIPHRQMRLALDPETSGQVL